MLKQVRQTIERFHMVTPGDTVIVSVSGGPDSTVLAHVLCALAPLLSFNLHLFHLDHCLRQESEDDAALIKSLANKLGVPCTIRRKDVARKAKRTGSGLEAAGRALRYGELQKLAAALDADRIATAHSQDDQAETILLQLVRGGGRLGLAGIPPVRPAAADSLPGCTVIRPLIYTSRRQILDYCRKYQLDFRVDRTNVNQAFLRNRVRHHLLPLLAEHYNSGIRKHLVHMGDIFREEESYLDMCAQRLVRLHNVDMKGPEVRLPQALLAEAPIALRRRVVRLAASRWGVTPDFHHVEAILSLSEKGAGTRRINLKGKLEAIVEYGTLVLQPTNQVRDTPDSSFTLHVPGVTMAFGLQFESQIIRAVPEHLPPSVLAVDPDRLPGPLTLRTRRPGDRFCPVGMSGSKKLQDFLVDLKIPYRQRDNLPLLATDHEIVWVINYRADRRFIAAPGQSGILIDARSALSSSDHMAATPESH